jgi:hypothetical protein
MLVNSHAVVNSEFYITSGDIHYSCLCVSLCFEILVVEFTYLFLFYFIFYLFFFERRFGLVLCTFGARSVC